MVTETSQRVKELIKAPYHGNHIDEMTEKKLSWPNPNPVTNSSFLNPHKASQTKPGRKASHIRL